MPVSECFQYEKIVDSICDLKWENLSSEDLTDVAIIYYYFSIQFRENLEVARQLYPDDANLIELESGECNTDNLSPWPGVAHVGEKIDHDEFMRRAIHLSPIADDHRSQLDAIGQSYLAYVRGMSAEARAMSIASYEDGGLEKVFRAFLTATQWNSRFLEAFKHFLVEHIRFDLDPELGHGALARHLRPNDDVLPLWAEFKRVLVEAVPALQA